MLKRQCPYRFRWAWGIVGVVLAFSGAVRATPDKAPVDFNILSQPLAAALHNLAIQANCQIFFEDSVVSGLSSSAVVGRMSVNEALARLLSGSALEFAQDDGGVIVVRRKLADTAAARHPKPRVHASQAISIDSPVTAPEQPTVAAAPAEGEWMVGLRAAYLAPANGSSAFSSKTPAVDLAHNGIGTSDRWLAEADFEYFFGGSWSSEVAVLAPRGYDLSVRSSAGDASAGRVGSFTQLSGYMGLNYYFTQSAQWRPYLGIGANVASFYHVAALPYSLASTSVGPAAQAGLNVKLGEGWFFNADIKWARVRTDLRYQGVDVSTVRIDPVVYGIGIAYRFGSCRSIPRFGTEVGPSALEARANLLEEYHWCPICRDGGCGRRGREERDARRTGNHSRIDYGDLRITGGAGRTGERIAERLHHVAVQ